jgi:NDP-sugar pyrophosphorylase family protein
MQCVILAGGIGSRTWSDTRTVPKTLVPVLDTRFAAWQLSWLAHSGIRSIVYSIGYLGDAVRTYVGDGNSWAYPWFTSTRAKSCVERPARCASPWTPVCSRTISSCWSLP